MALGIDVGAVAIAAALDEGTVVQRRSALLSVEHSELAEQFLEQEDTLSARTGDRMYAIGDTAEEFSGIVDETPDRFVRDGAVAATEEDAPALIETIIDGFAPDEEGPLGYVSYPGSSAVDEAIETAADTLGFAARAVGPGIGTAYAVGLSTTLSVVIGATKTIATLVVENVPIARAMIDRGTDWIERQYAEATGRDPDTFVIDRADTTLDDSGALALQYDALFGSLAEEITGPDWTTPGDPIPVVVAGAAPDGIEDRIAGTFADASLPFELGEVRRIADPVTAPVRGALLTARAEPADRHSEAAAVPYAPGRTDGDAFERAIEAATATASAAPADATVGADGAGGGIGNNSPSSGVSTTNNDAADQSGANASGANTTAVHDEPSRTTIEPLAADVETLSNRLAALRADVDGLLEEDPGAELRETIETLETDVEELETELSDLEAETATDVDPEELATAIETLTERVDELAANVADAESVDELETTVERLEDETVTPAELAPLEQRLDELEAGVVDEAEIETLRDELEAIAEEDGTEAEITALSERVDDLEDQLPEQAHIETLRDQLDQLEREAAETEALEALHDRLDALEGQTVDEQTLDSIRDRLDQLEASAAAAESEPRDGDLEEHIETIDESVSSLDGRVDEVDETVATLDDRIEAVDETVTTLDGRLDAVDDQLEELETPETVLESLRSGDGTKFEAIADLRGELEQVHSTAEDLQQRVDAIDDAAGADVDSDAVASVHDRLEEIETRLDSIWDRFETRIEELEDRIVGVQDDIVDTDERVDGVEDSLANVDDHVEDVDRRLTMIEDVDDQVETVALRVTKVKDRVDDLDSRLSESGDVEVSGAISEIRTQIDQLDERIEMVSQTAIDAEVRTADLGERIESIATSVDELRSTVEGSEAAGEGAADELPADVQQRLEEVEAVASQAAAEVEVLTKQLEDTPHADGDVDAELETLRARVDDLDAALDDLESRESEPAGVESLEARVDDLAETIEDGPGPDSVDELRTDLDTLEDRVESLPSGSDTPAEPARIRELRADFDDLENELDSLREELSAITELERRFDRVDDIKEDVAALQELRTDIEDVDETIAELQDRSTERRAMLVQAVGLVVLGLVGAVLGIQTGQLVLGIAFAAVPVIVSGVVWSLLS
jgi:chromosome segregation ATPase